MTYAALCGPSERVSEGPAPDLLRRIVNPYHVRSTEVDGKLWYSAKDVCAVIGISDDRAAYESLEQIDRTKVEMPTVSGIQTVRAITIDGVINLLLRGRKPQARAFQRWLIEQVRQTLV